VGTRRDETKRVISGGRGERAANGMILILVVGEV
jgi:hypothetical protein